MLPTSDLLNAHMNVSHIDLGAAGRMRVRAHPTTPGYAAGCTFRRQPAAPRTRCSRRNILSGSGFPRGPAPALARGLRAAREYQDGTRMVVDETRPPAVPGE